MDHDCDGEPLNGFGVGGSCEAGFGVCAVAGTAYCAADGTGACDAVALPPSAEEICGNGEDDDCDGAVDETGGAISVSLVEIWSGDPEFDYARCDLTSGEEPRCSVVEFEIANIGVVEIPDTTLVGVFAEDAGTRSEVSEPVAIGRAIAVGESDTFTLCWENPLEFRDVDVGVSIEGACTIAEAVTTTADRDLGECGPEQCDGFDNDADGAVDERGEACPLITQQCFHDFAIGPDYVCVNGLSAESFERLGCSFGEECVRTICVSDTSDAGACAAAECEGDTRSLRFANDPGERRSQVVSPGGCRTTRSGAPSSGWLIVVFLVASGSRKGRV